MTELAAVIRAFVLRKFGPLEQMDDCVQEVLLSLHQARHTYDPSRPFRPWFFAIVRHRTIDLLRQSRQEAEVSPLSEEQMDPDVPEPIPSIDAGRLLQGLSSKLRETLILTKLMGYSTRECALRQGVSESVVKIRIHRGIRRLRALSEADVGSEPL